MSERSLYLIPMRRLVFGLFLFVLAAPAWAQPGPPQLGSSIRTVFSVMPTYQTWDDQRTFSEISVPVRLQVAFSRSLSMSLATSTASAEGDDMATVSGLTDTRFSVNYRYELGRARVMTSLGLNLPSGQRELSPDEFVTAFFISQDTYRFQVPSFGQGLNWSPGVVLAMPVSEAVVVGLGFMYQGRGAYRPLETFGDYNPSDEIVLTGGFDLRLATTTFFSTDLTYTVYQTDQLDDRDVFAAGDKLVASGQFRHLFGLNEFWLFGRYRTRAENEVIVAGQLRPEPDKSLPDNAEFMSHLSLRVHRAVQVRLLAEGRFFEASAQREALAIWGLGVAPELLLSRRLRVPLRVRTFFGDISGLDVSAGLVVAI